MPRPGAVAVLSGLYFDLHVDYPSREIVVEGGLDVACAPGVATAVAALQRAGDADITVRLDQVTFIDMSAVGVLVGALASQVDRGFRLIVTGVSEQLSRSFVLGGVTHLLVTDQA